MEEIVRVVEEQRIGRFMFQIVESKYEFGTHYVLVTDGEPGFHSIDLERVQNYLKSIAKSMA